MVGLDYLWIYGYMVVVWTLVDLEFFQLWQTQSFNSSFLILFSKVMSCSFWFKRFLHFWLRKLVLFEWFVTFLQIFWLFECFLNNFWKIYPIGLLCLKIFISSVYNNGEFNMNTMSGFYHLLGSSPKIPMLFFQSTTNNGQIAWRITSME